MATWGGERLIGSMELEAGYYTRTGSGVGAYGLGMKYKCDECFVFVQNSNCEKEAGDRLTLGLRNQS